MDCWNIYWSGRIVYKSAGRPAWTAGTSTGVVNSGGEPLRTRVCV